MPTSSNKKKHTISSIVTSCCQAFSGKRLAMDSSMSSGHRTKRRSSISLAATALLSSLFMDSMEGLSVSNVEKNSRVHPTVVQSVVQRIDVDYISIKNARVVHKASHALHSRQREGRANGISDHGVLGTTSVHREPQTRAVAQHSQLNTNQNRPRARRVHEGPNPAFRKCADEGFLCSCNGEVFYGTGTAWYVSSSNDSLWCTNGVFGDPIPGSRKSCLCSDSGPESGAMRIEPTFVGFENHQGIQEAVEHALRIWKAPFVSIATLRIEISFAMLGDGVLGSSTPVLIRNFAHAPLRNTYYPAALATDLCTRKSNCEGNTCAELCPRPAFHMYLSINRNFNNWYFGLDGNPGHNEHDVISAVLHELCHGMGFVSSVSLSGTRVLIGHAIGNTRIPSVFDTLLIDGTSGRAVMDLDPSAAYSALTSNNLWIPAGKSSPAKLAAPSTFDPATSVSHLDDVYSGADEDLMVASRWRSTATHSIGSLALCIMQKLGWIVTENCDTTRTEIAVPEIVLSSMGTHYYESGSYQCAEENSFCFCNRQIRYGMEGMYRYLSSDGGINCSNANFGDPAPGRLKRCTCSGPVPAVPESPTDLEDHYNAREARLCGVEGSHCTCNGVVRYGANGHFNFQRSTNSISCSNGVFGDPIPGTLKSCTCSESIPTPPPTRMPSQMPTTSMPSMQLSTAPPSQMPTPDPFVEVGDGCCRTSHGEGSYETNLNVPSIDACIALCRHNSQFCTGIEWIGEWNICEVHTETITHTNDHDGCMCMVRSADANDRNYPVDRETVTSSQVTQAPSAAPSPPTVPPTVPICPLPKPFQFRGKRGSGYLSICSASKINRHCSMVSTISEASRVCSSVGARLCTRDELENDVARGSGCGYDLKKSWSSTPCGSSGHFLVAGSTKMMSKGLPNSDPMCSSSATENEHLAVRCCSGPGG